MASSAVSSKSAKKSSHDAVVAAAEEVAAAEAARAAAEAAALGLSALLPASPVQHEQQPAVGTTPPPEDDSVGGAATAPPFSIDALVPPGLLPAAPGAEREAILRAVWGVRRALSRTLSSVGGLAEAAAASVARPRVTLPPALPSSTLAPSASSGVPPVNQHTRALKDAVVFLRAPLDALPHGLLVRTPPPPFFSAEKTRPLFFRREKNITSLPLPSPSLSPLQTSAAAETFADTSPSPTTALAALSKSTAIEATVQSILAATAARASIVVIASAQGTAPFPWPDDAARGASQASPSWPATTADASIPGATGVTAVLAAVPNIPDVAPLDADGRPCGGVGGGQGFRVLPRTLRASTFSGVARALAIALAPHPGAIGSTSRVVFISSLLPTPVIGGLYDVRSGARVADEDVQYVALRAAAAATSDVAAWVRSAAAVTKGASPLVVLLENTLAPATAAAELGTAHTHALTRMRAHVPAQLGVKALDSLPVASWRAPQTALWLRLITGAARVPTALWWARAKGAVLVTLPTGEDLLVRSLRFGGIFRGFSTFFVQLVSYSSPCFLPRPSPSPGPRPRGCRVC